MQDRLLLKKYPNRRLYNTEASTYVTLKDVADLIREGRQVVVVDAKTEEDVTPFILVQVLMEKIKKNSQMLPSSLLHLIIRFGDDTLSEYFDKYLEHSISSYLNYKKIMDEQFRLCMELGMDFSKKAGTPFSGLDMMNSMFTTPFSGVSEHGTGTEEKENDQ